jgi:hypothetical protein
MEFKKMKDYASRTKQLLKKIWNFINIFDIPRLTREISSDVKHINGKMMKLVVNKSPVYDYKGSMFATCGTGRNVTDWYDAVEDAVNDLKLSKADCTCFQQEDVDIIINALNKFIFKVGDHVRQNK